MSSNKKDQTRKIESESLERSLTVTRGTENDEERTIELAFSSEEPYERWFGTEVLDHSPESVRLDRLNNAGAVLVNHDTDDQVGVVINARIDEDGKGRALIRFSRSQRGEEIYNDVKDHIRQLVSVGYRINKYEVTEREGQSDLVRVTDWTPYEISIVAVPADSTVGVGRSDKPDEQPLIIENQETTMSKQDAPAVETPDIGAIQEKTRKEEMSRINAIRSTAEAHDLEEMGRQAISEGWSAEKFNQEALAKVGERNNQARVDTKHDGEVDLTPKEEKRYSLSNLMLALANPQDRGAQQRAAFELEVSDAAIADFGTEFKARGAYIPQSILERANNVGTPVAGGNLVATDLLSGSFVDVLRNNSAVMGAGATMMSGLVGNVDIPRQTAGSSMTWIASEDGDATESEPTFDQIALTPKDAAVYTEATRRALQQTTPSIDAIIRRDLAIAIALGIDAAALYGTGATGQPRGIANQTGIIKKVFSAAAPTYVELVNMIRQVMDANALTGMPSWLIDPAGWEALSTTPKQGSGVEGNFIMGEGGSIKGYGSRMSTQVTAEDYFFGDWSQLLIGEWGGMELNVDPYTHSLKGRVRYVAFKTVDTAVRHPECFAHGNDTP